MAVKDGTAMAKEAERRSAPRRNLIDTHLVTADLGFQSGALLLDLSASGIGVQAIARARVGTTTEVHFQLPEDGGRVDAVGTVSWSDSSGRVGIRFNEVAAAGRDYLASWLSQEGRPQVAPSAALEAPIWPLAANDEDAVADLRRNLVAQQLQGDAALSSVLECCRTRTRGTGGAIALDEAGDFVCRASSGTAPPVGAHLDPSSGLSGECVRTGEVVRCDDTQSDPRVDSAVCRKLDLRSVVIVPVKVGSRVAGVLELFSSDAHAFQSSDILLLRDVANLIAELTPVRPAPTAETLAVAPVAEVPPESATIPAVETAAEPPVRSAAAQPVAAPAELPVRPSAIPAVATASEATPKRVATSAVEAAPEAPPKPTAIAGVATAAGAPAKSAATSAFETAAEAPSKAGRISVVATVAEALPTSPAISAVAAGSEALPKAPVISTATTASQALRKAAASSAAETVSQALPATAVLETEAVQEELPPGWVEAPFLDEASEHAPRSFRRLKLLAAAVIATLLGVSAWVGWARGRSHANMQPVPASTATPLPAPGTAPAVPTTAPAVISPPATVPAAPAATAHVAAVPAPRPASPSKNGTPVLTLPPPSSQSVLSAAEPPPVLIPSPEGNEAAGLSSVLGAKVATPSLAKQSVLVSKGVTGGRLIRRIEPAYPPTARNLHLSGTVVLQASVDVHGRVRKVTVISGNSLLAASAISAVKDWRYEPFMLDGVPVDTDVTVKVSFAPKD